MMNCTPIIKSFSPAPIDRREVYRYMKCGEQSDEIDALIDKAIAMCDGELRYDTVSIRMPIVSKNGGEIELGTIKFHSYDLEKALAGCDGVVIFAATVGLGIDRLIARYGRQQPSLALCIQALGAERIESLCDQFCADLKARGFSIRPRFSAGYGDLPIEFQKSIFSLLDCHKSIGLTLNQSLLMSPSKSVTAIIGIKNCTEQKNENT